MNNVNTLRRGEIEFIKSTLRRYFNKGNNPPEQIIEWRNRWFPKHEVQDVYFLVYASAIELREKSKGRIQFRYHYYQHKWKFHEGLDDYLSLIIGAGQQIGGHLKTQDIDTKLGKELIPNLKSEITIIPTPIINVGKEKKDNLKEKYGTKTNTKK